MDDPRLKFLDSLDLNNSRVKNFPGYIFICGGSTPNDLSKRPLHSLRHHLIDRIQKTKISLGAPLFVAESFNTCLELGTYDDLITFERHLAGLANVIPIILESAGAIAEFGAFSQEPTLKAKLLVFRASKFAGDKSFINFGLMRFMDGDGDRVIRTYPWTEIDPTDSGPAESANSDIIQNIIEDIRKRVAENYKQTFMFRPDDHGHRMVLIEDLIKLMIGLRRDEIVLYLQKVGINVDKRTIKQYLFLLCNIGIIEPVDYGARYFFSRRMWKNDVSYSFKNSDEPFDRGTQMELIEQFYRSEKDKRLHAASVFARTLKGGD